MKKQLVGFHSLLDLRLAPGIKRFKRLQIDISAKVWIYMEVCSVKKLVVLLRSTQQVRGGGDDDVTYDEDAKLMPRHGKGLN